MLTLLEAVEEPGSEARARGRHVGAEDGHRLLKQEAGILPVHLAIVVEIQLPHQALLNLLPVHRHVTRIRSNLWKRLTSQRDLT